jgi:ketosteroid isomerase-like protein
MLGAMRSSGVMAMLAVAACARPAARAPVRSAAPATRVAAELAAAVSAHDAARVAALFAPDGEMLVELARLPDVELAIGRIWADGRASVIEIVVTATHGEHPIGVVGAVAVELDAEGRAASARLYLDRVTVVGQADPSQLPAGARIREPVTEPPAGSAVAIATGTPTERANLRATDEILTRLVAHDPAGVLAPSSDDYVYDDFAGPGPLDRAGTRQLLEGFLGLVQDFAIVATPIHFAAGDDVVVEQIEHLRYDGREVTLHSIDIKRFRDGQVVREWQFADGTEVLTQLLGQPVPELPYAVRTEKSRTATTSFAPRSTRKLRPDPMRPSKASRYQTSSVQRGCDDSHGGVHDTASRSPRYDGRCGDPSMSLPNSPDLPTSATAFVASVEAIVRRHAEVRRARPTVADGVSSIS